jgi:hypothetical protein
MSAKGRIDPFAELSSNDCFLRKRDMAQSGSSRREADIAKRGLKRREWAVSSPSQGAGERQDSTVKRTLDRRTGRRAESRDRSLGEQPVCGKLCRQWRLSEDTSGST